jgi:hypothetical protein
LFALFSHTKQTDRKSNRQLKRKEWRRIFSLFFCLFVYLFAEHSLFRAKKADLKNKTTTKEQK